MSTDYPRTLDEWLATVGQASEDMRSDAVFILGHDGERGWVHGTTPDVIALGAALWKEPPRLAPALSPAQALGLASRAFAAEIVPGFEQDPADTDTVAERVRQAVTAVQRGDVGVDYGELEQRAALAAVRQLGGAARVGIPEWLESALGDVENWTACGHLIERTALACANTFPGRRWQYVPQLGMVVFQHG